MYLELSNCLELELIPSLNTCKSKLFCTNSLNQIPNFPITVTPPPFLPRLARDVWVRFGSYNKIKIKSTFIKNKSPPDTHFQQIFWRVAIQIQIGGGGGSESPDGVQPRLGRWPPLNAATVKTCDLVLTFVEAGSSSLNKFLLQITSSHCVAV